MEVVYTPTLGLNELNPALLPGQSPPHRRRPARSTSSRDNDSSFTVRARLQSLHRRPRESSARALAVGNSRIDRELRDRTHIERIASLGLSGQRDRATGSATVDYQLLGAYSDQFDPLTMTTTFRESRVTFAPNVTATSIDPDNVQANPTNDDVEQLQLPAADSRDQLREGPRRRRVVQRPDAAQHLQQRRRRFSSSGSSIVTKQKGRDRNERTFTTPATLKMTNFLETGFDLPPYLDGRYDLTPYMKQSRVAAIPDTTRGNGGAQSRSRRRGIRRHRANERRATAMVEIYAGSKLLILPGVRVRVHL